MGHPLENLIDRGRFAGPLSIVHTCPICSKVLQSRRRGGGGRGQGMRMGNKARGLVIAHIKAEHPAEAHVEYIKAWARLGAWTLRRMSEKKC